MKANELAALRSLRPRLIELWEAGKIEKEAIDAFDLVLIAIDLGELEVKSFPAPAGR